MRNNKKQKIMAIVALCISVLGLTLGFAAFSNTLTISSSATVKPDQKDFLLKPYGLEDTSEDFAGVVWYPESYTSSVLSKPYTKPGVSATDAKIESSFNESGSNKITISNLHPTFTNPNDRVEYWFMIKNEGKYDAYLSTDEITKYSNITDSITCAPVVEEGKESATESLVDDACKMMYIEITAHSFDGTSITNTEINNVFDVFKIDKYENSEEYGYIILRIYMSYITSSDPARADGEFTVTYPDIELEFTTVPPTE